MWRLRCEADEARPCKGLDGSPPNVEGTHSLVPDGFCIQIVIVCYKWFKWLEDVSSENEDAGLRILEPRVLFLGSLCRSSSSVV